MHRCLPAALGAVALLAVGSGARAESAFELPYPALFGHLPAATYDDAGDRIGGADLVAEHLDGGVVRIYSRSGRDGGARTVATADLVPVVPGRTLRLAREESRSLDPQGHSLGVLTVDHVHRVATCSAPDGTVTDRLQLPEHDRVVNVPMNLFFLPLVRGDTDRLQFQLFLCRDGARLWNFDAWVEHGGHGQPIEVRYAPDLGHFVSVVARGFVPRLSFWFDSRAPYNWMAHRLPLYAGGPEVLVIRDGAPRLQIVQ